jgi:hypothetical protein
MTLASSSNAPSRCIATPDPADWDAFNAPDGDVVLRSSAPHSTSFRVHRCLLAIASPFFQTMFELPQPASSMNKGAIDLPVVDMVEDQHTLDALLRLIYPVARPQFATVDALVPVLAAAVKYEVSSAIEDLRARLVSSALLTPVSALAIFAIADRFHFEPELQVASRLTLHARMLDNALPDTLRHISAHSFFRLLVLHRTRGAALLKALDETALPKCMSGVAHYETMEDFRRRARTVLETDVSGTGLLSAEFLIKSKGACCLCVSSMMNTGDYPWHSLSYVDTLRAAFAAAPERLE